MPDTLRLTLAVPDDVTREPVLADLADLGFDAFEEQPDALVAYAPAPRWDGTVRDAVATLLRRLGLDVDAMTEEIVADRDWNAEWEAALQPIDVGPFVVAPTWAELGPGHDPATVLRIDPKMSFGTGYHETTRIVLRLLAESTPEDARVLDVGTGTGVLAIAALKLGAASAIGVDGDPWSVTNGHENAALNEVAGRVEIREGSLEVVPEDGFGLVVANIISSILEPMLPALVEKTEPGGTVVLSGLLATERDRIVETMAGLGCDLRSEGAENEWWGGVWVRGA